jgi:hypothetical protein
MSLPPVVEMAPGIGAVYWRSRDMAQMTSTSWDILSVIQLQLLPGISVHDISSPAGKLWQATLEYVSTIPGHTSILWGTERAKEDIQENICLLIQWESPLRWKEFQASMGLSLMVELLRENPWNRCIRISLPDLSTTSKTLKLFWRTFTRDEFTEKKRKFDEKWRALKKSWTEKNTGESCTGDWLEGDGGMISVHSKDPGPQIAAVKAQDRVFCVLHFEEAEENDSERVEKDISGLLGEGEINRKFLLLKPVKLELQVPKHPSGNRIQFTANSLSSLAQLLPRRHYFAYTYITVNIDGLQDKRRNADPPRSQFPGPHGDYMQMGSLHQYMRPALPSLEEQDHLIANIVYLSFKPGVIDLDRSVQKNFSDLRYEIKEIEGCSDLVWCRPDMETSYDCILFICLLPLRFDTWPLILFADWKNGSMRLTYFEAVQDLIRKFNQTTSSLTREPYFYSFKPRYSFYGLRVENFLLLEITTFKISNSPYGIKLFRRFYESFERFISP